MNTAPATGALRHRSAHSEIFDVSAAERLADAPQCLKRPLTGRDVAPAHAHARAIAFENECRLLAALHGPATPQYVAAHPYGDAPWLLMEAIPGATVADVLARYAAEPGERHTAEIAQIGQAMALAVHALHRQGVVHHNLQAQHIMLREDGTAALLDFGMAWHAGFPDLLALGPATKSRSHHHTGPQRSDRRADITAVGRILYALCTGHPPAGKHPQPPRATHAETTPPWLQEIVMRCLNSQDQTGYASAALLAFDLRFPTQVQVGAQGLRTHLDAWGRWRQWVSVRTPSAAAPAATLVLTVVPSPEAPVARHHAMRHATQRALGGHPNARLVCASLHPPSTDHSLQRSQVIQLEMWAAALCDGAPPSHGIACQPITSGDAARSLLDWARCLAIDHVLIDAEEAQWRFAETDILRTALPFTLTLVHADAPL